MNLHRQQESNQSQNKSTEIKQARLTPDSSFHTECKKQLQKPSVQVIGLLRNEFMLTYSRGTTYPEWASSIHTSSLQDTLAASQQIFYFNLPFIQTGWNRCRTWSRSASRTTSTLEFISPQGGVNQCCLYGFITLSASCDLLLKCLWEKWVTGVHRLIHCLWWTRR